MGGIGEAYVSAARRRRQGSARAKPARLLAGAASIAFLGAFGMGGARAADDPIAQFYKDKTIAIIVAGGPDGGYGQYALLIAPFLTKYMPGHPSAIARYMPGAGGIVAANYAYNLAARDGTQIAALLSSLPISERIGRHGIRYESAKFAWIGRFSSLNGAITVRRDAAATTLAEMEKIPIVIGSTGVQQLPILSNWALGTKFNIISGYKGSQGSVLAYERGEVDGFYTSWTALKVSYPQHLHDPHVLQSGLEAAPGYSDVPLLIDLVQDPLKKQVCAFFAAEDTMGRFLVAPPDTPPERVAALRKAFDSAIRDPEFLAKAVKLDIEPRSGAALEQIIARLFAVPPNIIALAKKAVGL